MEEPRFHYKIKKEYAVLNDGKCCQQVTDYTGFHFFRCKSKAKEVIDGIGLCGKHANSLKKWRNI